MNKRMVAILLAACAASPLSTAPSMGSDLPCVWVKYDLPEAGSNNIPQCSPVNRPPGWTYQNTTKVNQPIIGQYYVEVGITVPLPPG